MEIIKCCECGNSFPRTDNWVTRCLPCWKAHRGYDLTKSDKAFLLMQGAFDALRQTPPKVGLSKSILRKLITLCHPDRHENSELAAEVTRWLIDQKQEG